MQRLWPAKQRRCVLQDGQGSTAAATTLLKVMVDIATPPSTRVRAAEAVLNHAAKAIEIEDIDARLRELEAAAEANKDGRR